MDDDSRTTRWERRMGVPPGIASLLYLASRYGSSGAGCPVRCVICVWR
ncbi:hypothetical protein ACWDWS_06000 [Streptomyces sp. NPDC003328]